MNDLFSFNGVLGRKDYFLVSFGVILAVTVSGYIDVESPLGAFLVFAVLLLAFTGYVAATAKRLRDVGWSPWGALVTLVPAAGGLLTILLWFWPSKKGI